MRSITIEAGFLASYGSDVAAWPFLQYLARIFILLARCMLIPRLTNSHASGGCEQYCCSRDVHDQALPTVWHVQLAQTAEIQSLVLNEMPAVHQDM